MALQPDLLQAQKNKALIEQLLQGQPPQPQEQEQDQAEAQNDPAETRPAQVGQPEGQPASPQPGQPPSGESEEPAAQSQPRQGEEASPEPEPKQPSDSDAVERSAAEGLDGERRQALEQWLRQIPDDPAELLKRKFWYQQQQRQEQIR